MDKKITPSMETYLETIKKIKEEKKVVRVKGIARRLNVKMSSVSEALRNLSKEGFIKHEKYGYIELTSKGDKIAQEIDSRHKILFSFFTDILGINPDLADEDACKIEHVISQPALERLVKFLDFIKTCYKEKDNMLDNFKEYLSRRKSFP